MVGDLATAEDVVQDAFEQRTELVDAFRALPARQREVLALRYYLDISVADVSATLHLSEGAVRSHRLAWPGPRWPASSRRSLEACLPSSNYCAPSSSASRTR